MKNKISKKKTKNAKCQNPILVEPPLVKPPIKPEPGVSTTTFEQPMPDKPSAPQRIIQCSNRGCNHCKPDPKDKYKSYCTANSFRLEKVWDGSEDDYRLLCLEATNQTRKHATFLPKTVVADSKPLNQEEKK